MGKDTCPYCSSELASFVWKEKGSSWYQGRCRCGFRTPKIYDFEPETISVPTEAKLRGEIYQLRLKAKEHRKVIRHMQLQAERRNKEIDALGYVWCDGGCDGGMNRYNKDAPDITLETMITVQRNTDRMWSWFLTRMNRNHRRAFPGTMTEWIAGGMRDSEGSTLQHMSRAVENLWRRPDE